MPQRGRLLQYLNDGTVVSWGDQEPGGDSCTVQAASIGVEAIYCTYHASAAVLNDGTVLTWGNKNVGGDCSTVQAALIGVETIYSTDYAFAAVLKDGTSVT